MDKKSIQKKLVKFLYKLKKKIRVNQIIVFGSRANGNAHEDSDLDLFILSDDFKKMNEDQRLDLLHKVASKIDFDIDPWGFTPKEAEQADPQTTLGDAYLHGIRLI
ncbi:MAG: nucleotidyltransferase domain-containing protein [Candidatus Pacebacteria bacterium]|jgi:uncharacterized protein|nr:nucleotidyltransferase domain-containing protein [Candidatus Paceibacterota bacterium]MBT3511943.1 nucleotidyltransferase domain-containing protein [Candidatus Paceibacterota bacterium]MBT4005265.1 nucleotidyltransferase domain-containing protein [Candidatus Paceibacterota bacterium]MBT4358985.1 nucleotidyltransferase domain-containing protein [Candidatus Paceibacterota bacterium]MBT4680450.1 nucleotidyltransferase domain-containing protein [Candidatus Paceibacterota bacterium]